MEIQAPKFAIDQKVKFMNDNDSEAGRVLSFAFSPDSGWRYIISSRELDIPAKMVVDGIKHCTEDELVAVSDEPTAPVAPVQDQSSELGSEVQQ